MYTPLENSFYNDLCTLQKQDIMHTIKGATSDSVASVLAKRTIDFNDFLILLSDAATNFIEPIAQRAHTETLRNFGKSVQIFTPIYLANHCTNRCVYCGFSTRRDIPRIKLTMEEVEREAKSIASTGLRKILALTGDSPKITGADYLADCISILSRHFTSVGIEVPSMTIDEYAMQVKAGADSMTMFQETYNAEKYLELHPAGPKRDFLFRLDAPQRAIIAGMRSVNLGPLLGLDTWQNDVAAVALHATWIMDNFPHVDINISLPRMRPHTEGGDVQFTPQDTPDKQFVQALVALRSFLPQAGITMSTRETASFRNSLIPLGVTRVSAGVSTAVGGHSEEKKENSIEDNAPQFDISDGRSVDEMAKDLLALGYQPVFSDWVLPGEGTQELSKAINSSVTQI